MNNFYLYLIAVLLVLGCNSDENKTKETATDYSEMSSLADSYADLSIRSFPENYVYYSLNELDHGSLSDNSKEGIAKWDFIIDSLYEQFKNIPIEHEVGSESWYLYGYLKETLESERDLRVCKLEYATVNHLSGWHINFQRIAGEQPVGSKKARADAIRRWNQLPEHVNNEIANLKRGISEGYTVPKDIVKIVIEQLSKMLSEPVTESAFYSPANRDTNQVFKQEWQNIVAEVVYPTLKKYHDFLKNEYYKAARQSISLADLPNGKKIYQAYYRYHTSVKRDIEEIIEVGEYRLKVNNSKLRLYGREKFGKDSLPGILRTIIEDSVNYFNSAKEMLKFAKETVKKAKKKCKTAFYHLPKQDVEVVAISQKMQSSIGSHYIPTVDSAGKPSSYYINLSHPETKMQSELETEIFHETFPGHHLQLASASEKDTTHLLTKLFNVGGYTEGWASYAQVLADEMGLYHSGYSRFFVLGRSSRIMYLEAMIHSGKWTKEEALEFLKDYGSVTPKGAQMVINRIVAWPGQFSTYDTGLVEILELREKAMLTLGDDFDIKEFHKIVLDGGAMPLEMLREKVNWWLEKKVEK